jgi:hypothetical protein
MERIKRAVRLRDLQVYGVAQAAESGLKDVSVEEIVHRVLAERGILSGRESTSDHAEGDCKPVRRAAE